MGLPKVKTADPSERQSLVDTLRLGFSADPFLRWLWPRSDQFMDATSRMFDANAAQSVDLGTAYTTESFEGVALWLQPGEETDEDIMKEIMATTTSEDIRDDMSAVFKELEEAHPKYPCWYLPVIGVDPAHQGKGFGAALMKHALQRCDEDGLPAYLESSNPRNMTLYQRHGFEATGRIQVGASPPIHPMLREPRKLTVMFIY